MNILNGNMVTEEQRIVYFVEKLKEVMKNAPDTNYIKYGCSEDGKLISVAIYADAEAEKKSFQGCMGFTIEEVAVVSALSETQRKIILLQSQKEKIEKELAGLII